MKKSFGFVALSLFLVSLFMLGAPISVYAAESGEDEVIGTAASDLNGERDSVRKEPTNLSNFLTGAILQKTGADAVFFNGGSIRASIKAGKVTSGDIHAVQPFNNKILTIEVKGSDLLAAFERGFSAYPETSGSYCQVAGVKIQFDSSQPSGSRIKSVEIKGAALDPEKSYKLATNDFLAGGGDDYAMFKDCKVVEEFTKVNELIVNFVKEKGFEGAVTDDRVVDIAKK